jgi:pimeloyl-ACP methyl ester carboxylesterase
METGIRAAGRLSLQGLCSRRRCACNLSAQQRKILQGDSDWAQRGRAGRNPCRAAHASRRPRVAGNKRSAAGDLLKAQLEQTLAPDVVKPIAKAIDDIMSGKIVDPMPPGLSIPPPMQPGIASAFSEDPIAPLKLIDQPILVVGGGRDRQVARLDFDRIAAASPSAKALWLPDMNHVLVDVSDETDDLAAYNQPERALNAALIESIVTFIVANQAG